MVVMNKKLEDFYNLDLYEEGTVESEEFIFKQEIVDFIIEHLKWKSDYEYYPEYRSRDWYVPSEPEYATLEAFGTLELSKLETQFGEFKDGDIEALEYELSENENFKQYLKEVLEEEKCYPISNFSLGEKNIKVDRKRIMIHIKADDIELDKEAYRDW